MSTTEIPVSNISHVTQISVRTDQNLAQPLQKFSSTVNQNCGIHAGHDTACTSHKLLDHSEKGINPHGFK